MVSAVRLNALLDDLDRAGLDAGPGARQQAYMLYMLLSDSAGTDGFEHRFVDHLRPLVIRSREQSAAFDRVVSHWGLAPRIEADAVRTKADQAPPQAGQQGPAPRWNFPVPLPWLAGLAAGLFLIFWGLPRLAEPRVTLDPTPVEIDDPVAPVITPASQVPAPVIEVEEEEVAAPEDGGVLTGNTIDTHIDYLFLRYDFAPTLRELHEAYLFPGLSLEEVAKRTGLQPDLPLPYNAETYIRVRTAAGLGRNDRSSYYIETSQIQDSAIANWALDGADERLRRLRNFRSVRWESFQERGLDVVPISPEDLDRGQQVAQAYGALFDLSQPYTKAAERDTVNSILWAEFSPDGETFVTAGVGGINLWRHEGAAIESTVAIDNRSSAVNYASFSSDGSRVVAGGEDFQVILIDASNGELIALLDGHTDAIWTVVFSPDDSRILSASIDGSVRVWDTETGQQLAVFRENDVRFISAVFSADGTQVLASLENAESIVWDVASNSKVMTYGDANARDGFGGSANHAVFSPDGRLVATAGYAGFLRIWDRATGLELRSIVAHETDAYSIAFSPDSRRILTSGQDKFSRLWDVETGRALAAFESSDTFANSAMLTADGSKLIQAGANGIIDIWEQNSTDLWDQIAARVWSTAALAAFTRETLTEADGPTVATGVSDEDLVRQIGAMMHQHGLSLRLIDPPWSVPAGYGAHQAALIQRHAPLLAALTFFLIGLGAWLWSAFNLRAYLQRRRPGDPGRVIELFSDTRHQADKVQAAIRRAAKALLQRQPGRERLDIKASIRATAKARGLFTPVEKRDTRMPEYLFLIDARSRADHETQRTLDYLERLRKEHVPITHYFYERAPDRVRASMGAPAQSLDLIASEHSDKRLVLVGDAASMYSSNRSGSGGWKKTLETWHSKSFVTTVPVSEWGLEEEKFAQETGLSANVLSAEGLEALPTALFAEGLVGKIGTEAKGALDVPALPGLLRRDPERWIVDSEPDEDEWMELQTALVGYLSIAGWRWLCACAVYPVIEWDLTVALGQVLRNSRDEPIYTESLAARLSELPWMRAGEMPDWLRSRLIDEIDEIDRDSVRDLIAKILEAVDSERKTGGDAISLKFGYLKGREPDSDERFVDFVTRAPENMDKTALKATRKLRELLRPALWKRLVDPGALGWLMIGIGAAVIAWLIAPRYLGVPSHTGAWLPLVTMLLGPPLAWLVWRGGKHVWTSVPRDRAVVGETVSAWPTKIYTWLLSLLGISVLAAREVHPATRRSDAYSIEELGLLLRRRVEVWSMALMFLASWMAVIVLAVVLGAIGPPLLSLNAGWLIPLRSTLIGEVLLSLVLIGVVVGVLRLAWIGLNLQYGLARRLGDLATEGRNDLLGGGAGRLSRTVFVLGAVFVVIFAAAVISTQNAFSDAVILMSPLNTQLTMQILTIVSPFAVGGAVLGWHWWTMKRVARALNELDNPATESTVGTAAKAAA